MQKLWLCSWFLFIGSMTLHGQQTGGTVQDQAAAIDLIPSLETGVGANLSAYTVPDAIRPFYGNHPVGLNIYLRIRLRPR
jgi:hypothetical protein